MKRIVAVLGAVVLAVLVPPCTSTSTKNPPTQNAAKPNIVFVLTDDLSLNLVSHMPHVVALQKSGTTMSNYYVVDSLCCPSRSAIFTNSGTDGGYPAYNKNGNQQKTRSRRVGTSGTLPATATRNPTTR